MKNLIKCKSCGAEILKTDKICSSCGYNNKNFFMKNKILFGIIIIQFLSGILIMIALFVVLKSNYDNDTTGNTNNSSNNTNVTSSDTKSNIITSNTDENPDLLQNTNDVIITSITNSKSVIGDDVVNLIIKNNTNKVLKNVKIIILGYDSNGYPIKLNFGNDDYYKGKAENINILYQESKEFSWIVYSAENNLAKAKACILSYEFYDSVEQKNEYGSKWLKDNIGKIY